MIKQVPVVATPAYWTPEWHTFEIRSAAQISQTYTWTFRSEMIGYSLRHTWEADLLGDIPDASGEHGEISLPFSEDIQVRKEDGTLLTLGQLDITLVSETTTSVQVNYKLTLADGWKWSTWWPHGYWNGIAAFIGKLACIPEFSYEAGGPLALPHYPKTIPYIPPDEQPANGYYYDVPFSWNGAKIIFGGGTNPSVDQILAAGFNCCGPMMGFTQAFLDECLRKGLWVIGNVQQFFSATPNLSGAVAYVNQWKSHRAIGAWFFLDEPTMHAGFTKELQQTWYTALKAADPSRDFWTNFTSNVQDRYNPSAFDHCSVDVYPFNDVCFTYGSGEWNGDYLGYIRYCINRWNSQTNHIGGMAVAQAFWHLPEYLNPTGHIDDMLKKFQELGVGTQKDGYAMYIWTETPGGYGVVQDAALLAHVTTVNAGYNWPHLKPHA